MAAKFTQDENEHLDYMVDWSQWLPAGDTIIGSTFTPPDIADDDTFTADDDSFGDTSTTVWISGGTVGGVYQVTNTIVTAQGRQGERTLTFQIKQL